MVNSNTKGALRRSTPKSRAGRSLPGAASGGRPDFNLNAIADNLSQGIRVIDKDYTVLYINRAFAGISGVRPEEARGARCWEVFRSPFCHTPLCRLSKVLAGSSAVQAEIERTKPGGAIVPCLVTASPLLNAAGELIGVMESFQDITENRKLLARAKESEGLYQALIELDTEAGEAIVMLQDEDGREGVQTFMNDQWPRMTGYSKEELLGTSFFDLVVAEDRQASMGRHRQKMNGKSVPGVFELKILHKGGTTVPVELTGALTSYQGRRANVVYIRDVTERKAIEKSLKAERDKYHCLFEDAPVAIFESNYSWLAKYMTELRAAGVTDFKKHFYEHPDAVIEYMVSHAPRVTLPMNQALIDISEAADREEIIRYRKESLRKRDATFNVNVDTVTRLAEGLTKFTKEEDFITARGNKKYIQTTVNVAPGCEESLSSVYISFTDITARKKAEEELEKYKEHLEELVENRSRELIQANEQLKEQIKKRAEFTRTLVHELKTPLTPLLAASELLEANIGNPTLKKAATSIHQGARDLNERVDELLDLEKGIIGILQINPKPCDVVAIVHEAADYFKYTFTSKNQVFKVVVSGGVPDLCIEAKRIKQVLINLLDNASKFTPRSGRIFLRVIPKSDRVIVEIEDSGMGIPPDKKKDLFNPYGRIRGEQGYHAGLGIGLALSKILVNLHGGEIWVNDSKKRGTVVSFSLPYPTGILA